MDNPLVLPVSNPKAHRGADVQGVAHSHRQSGQALPACLSSPAQVHFAITCFTITAKQNILSAFYKENKAQLDQVLVAGV